MNDYSHKDFTGRTLIEAIDINDQKITGSCFSQANPNTVCFPYNMTGVTFINCNLDNCVIPVGNTVQGGSNRTIMVQNDMQHWVVDQNTLQPIVPVSPDRYLDLGLSIDPADIPPQPANVIALAEQAVAANIDAAVQTAISTPVTSVQTNLLASLKSGTALGGGVATSVGG